MKSQVTTWRFDVSRLDDDGGEIDRTNNLEVSTSGTLTYIGSFYAQFVSPFWDSGIFRFQKDFFKVTEKRGYSTLEINKDTAKDALIEALNFKDCKNAITNLLKAIDGTTDEDGNIGKIIGTDILTILDGLEKQSNGGAVFNLSFADAQEEAKQKYDLGRIPGGRGFAARTPNRYQVFPDGTKKIIENGLAILYVFPTTYIPGHKKINQEYAQNYLIHSFIHELVHISAKEGTFSHLQMNKAAKKLGSSSFRDYINDECTPKIKH